MPNDTPRSPKSKKADGAFQKFERLTKKLVSVPKAEADKVRRKRKA